MLTDDEAIIIMVDSNLQREQLLPSEKAFAYKMKLDAMKRQQGYRSDLTSATPLQKSERKLSREILAEQAGESHEQIRKCIRLTELITPILDMVDSGKIVIRPAVELSYLPKEQQTILLDIMQLEDCTPSHAQAIKMRKFADEGRMNEDVILSILSEEKGNQKEQFRMPKERISRYFSPFPPSHTLPLSLTSRISAEKTIRSRWLSFFWLAQQNQQFTNPASLDDYSLLVIDDLGVERNTEYAMEQMFTVIDSRYRSKKPLIVTTNLKLEEIKNPPDLAHARIYDRILERCAPVLFSGKNFREEGARATKAAAKEIVSKG